MPRRKKCCFKNNFTLIELLVSLAVFSILLLIMLQFFSGAQRLWVASENRNNVSADARVALQVIGDLLSKSYYTKSVLPGDTDLPFVVDNTVAAASKLYFITDSMYQLNPASTSDLYFVSIYRKPSTDELRIAYASGIGVAAYCFNGSKTVTDMCGLLDTFAPDDPAPVNNKLLAPNVLEFSVTAQSSTGSAYSTTASTVGYPGIINIKLRMLSAEDYKKWVEMDGKNTTEPTLAKEFREAQQQTFSKTVFLDKQYDL